MFVIMSAFVQSYAQIDFATYTTTLPNSAVTFKMVPIPAGNFLMGSSDKENHHKTNEGPQQKVSVAAFWMGEHGLPPLINSSIGYMRIRIIQ